LNRKQFFKIYVLIFIALYSEFNLANEEMFVSIPVNKNSDEDKSAVTLSNQNECSINLSGISGKVILSEKITEENVELIEMVKQELPADKKVEIFGDRAKPGLAHNLQSQKTKDKVQEIRKTKLKDKINPTITRI
jgi:hypothetical protein